MPNTTQTSSDSAEALERAPVSKKTATILTAYGRIMGSEISLARFSIADQLSSLGIFILSSLASTCMHGARNCFTSQGLFQLVSSVPHTLCILLGALESLLGLFLDGSRQLPLMWSPGTAQPGRASLQLAYSPWASSSVIIRSGDCKVNLSELSLASPRTQAHDISLIVTVQPLIADCWWSWHWLPLRSNFSFLFFSFCL